MSSPTDKTLSEATRTEAEHMLGLLSSSKSSGSTLATPGPKGEDEQPSGTTELFELELEQEQEQEPGLSTEELEARQRLKEEEGLSYTELVDVLLNDGYDTEIPEDEPDNVGLQQWVGNTKKYMPRRKKLEKVEAPQPDPSVTDLTMEDLEVPEGSVPENLFTGRFRYNRDITELKRKACSNEAPPGLFLDAQEAKLYTTQLRIDKIYGYAKRTEQVWYIPEDIVEMLEEGDVERWQRTQELYDAAPRDRFLATDGRHWFVDHGFDQPKKDDPFKVIPFHGLPEMLPDPTTLSDVKHIVVGQPGYWLRFTRGPRSHEAVPVYGYMLDMGRGYAVPPSNAAWRDLGWDDCEYMLRCAACGRELPPSMFKYIYSRDGGLLDVVPEARTATQYQKHSNHRRKSIHCRACLDARQRAEVILRHKTLGMQVTLDEEEYLHDYKVLIVLQWRKGLMPQGDLAKLVIGDKRLRKRAHQALRHQYFSYERFRTEQGSARYATKQAYIAKSPADAVKSKTSIGDLFATQHGGRGWSILD